MKTLLPIAILFLMGMSLFAQQNVNSNKIHIGSETISPEHLNYLNSPLDLSKSIAFGYSFVLMQMEETPSFALQEEMKSKGVHFLRYIPHKTYLVALSEKIEASTFLKWKVKSVSPIKSTYKTSSEDKVGITQKVITDATYYLHIPDFLSSKIINQLKQTKGISNIETINKTILKANISGDKIIEILALPYILFVEKYTEIIPEEAILDDDHQAHHIQAVRSTRANGFGLDGTGITLGVFDIKPSIDPHIDLNDRLIDENPVTLPYSSHGLKGLGIIAGNGNRDPRIVGLAPGSKVISENIYNGSSLTSRIAALNSTYGMTITNHSYLSGSYGGSYGSAGKDADDRALNNPEILECWAAGNILAIGSGAQSSKNQLSTSSSDLGNGLVEKYGNHSTGPTLDGRIKPEILSDTRTMSTFETNLYASGTGTSFASPATAAGAAVISQKYKLLNHGNNPPAALLKALLLNGADDLGANGPDYIWGFGSMNVYNSVKMLEEGNTFSDQISQAVTKTHNIDIPTNTTRLKVMLYWNDPAGATNCHESVCLVNDLDLRIKDPSTNTYLPMVLDPQNPTSPAIPGIERLNNVEQLLIDHPTPGNYTVEIEGYNVPIGLQDYYVVYEFLTDDILITHPFEGDPILEESRVNIFWTGYDNVDQTYDIDYTIDDGATWNNIVTGLIRKPNESKNYVWIKSANNVGSENFQIRVRRTSGISTEGITGKLTLSDWVVIDQNCLESGNGNTNLSWNNIDGAVSYNVYTYKKGDFTPQFHVNTSNLFASISGLSPGINTWVSVEPVFVNGGKGLRSKAVPTLIERVYVNPLAQGNNDGSSWENAKTNMFQAVNSPAKEIWLTEGTYKGTFYLPPCTELIGGFPQPLTFSGGYPDLADRNPELFPTKFTYRYSFHKDLLILSDENLIDGIWFLPLSSTRKSSINVTAGKGITKNIKIKNSKFQEQNGSIGAIQALSYNGNINLEVDNCVFSNCASYGIYLNGYQVHADIKNSTFHNLSATTKPAIRSKISQQSTLDIVNCIFDQDLVFDFLGPVKANINFSSLKEGSCPIGALCGNNNFYANDPQFQSTSNHSYPLSAASNLIDVANESVSGESDYTLANRPQGVSTDIGAYEFTPILTKLFVNDNAVGANNGSNWADAFNDLQDALALVSDDCLEEFEIWVAEGTYNPSSTNDKNEYFELKGCSKLIGGFPDPITSPISDPDLLDRDPALYLTELSGELGATGDVSDNSLSILKSIDQEGPASLDGFVIQHANGITSSAYSIDKDLHRTFKIEIMNTIFKNNISTKRGGAITIDQNNFSDIECIIKNTSFKYNSANRGGGIWMRVLDGSSIDYKIDSSEFRQNNATLSGALHMINVGNESLVNGRVNHTLFDSNYASLDATVYSYIVDGESILQFNQCDFTDNIVNRNASAFYSNTNAASFNYAFEQCTFDSNHSPNGKGTFHQLDRVGSSGSTILSKCRFKENTSKWASGIYLYNTTSNINFHTENSLFYSNSIQTNNYGVDYHSYTGSNSTTNTTFVNNSLYELDSPTGFSMYNLASNTNCISNLNLTNTVIYSNLLTLKKTGASNVQVDHSLLSDVNCPVGINCSNTLFNLDPDFVDPANGDLHLLESSPCIDAGTATGTPLDDYDFNPRPQNGGFDIGAYEFEHIPQLPISPEIANATSNEKVAELNIWPNPSRSKITYESDSKIETIQVFDQLGKLIWFENVSQAKGFLKLELDPGIYFLKGKSGDGLIQVKAFQIIK